MNGTDPLQTFGLNLVVITPLNSALDMKEAHGGAASCANEYQGAISEIQRFRGRVYSNDGAIPRSALDSQERHYQEFDLESYHLCIRDDSGQLRGCLRLRAHTNEVKVEELKVYELFQRMPLGLRELYIEAVLDFLKLSRVEGVGIGEVGGWAVDQPFRHCRTSMLLLVAGWALYWKRNGHCGCYNSPRFE